jgi:hypothetical protein
MLMPLLALAQDPEFKPPRNVDFGQIRIAINGNMVVTAGGLQDAEGKAVVEPGDKLLAWNGAALPDRDTFCRKLYASKPGESVEIEFERKAKDGSEAGKHKAKVRLGDRNAAYADLYKYADKRKRTFDWREQKELRKGGPLREKLAPIWKEHKLDQPWDNLLAANERELQLWDNYESTSACELLLRSPLTSHQFVQQVGDALARGDLVDKPFDTVSGVLMNLQDRRSDTDTDTVNTAGLEEMRLALHPLDWTKQFGRPVEERVEIDTAWVKDYVLAWRDEPGFEKSVDAAHRMRGFDGRWASVLPKLQPALDQLVAGLTKRFEEYKWSPYSMMSGMGGMGAAPKRNPQKGKSARDDGAYISWRTHYGVVAIGGYGRNVWTSTDAERFAIILDMGGDDEYVDCASTHIDYHGSGEFKGFNRVSIVIDLAGNDHYRSTGKWGVAAGMLGTAIIDDRDGDDVYECKDWGIGAAFGGIGLLIDRKGNDRYLGGTNTIGCAAYGVGGVIDLDGRDTYDAHAYSIGVGQPGGVGFVLDRAGDDTYRCGGVVASPYGTEGEYMGMGIGCGFGWRGLASGGIGLVVDVTGNDIYNAGEFGLGCGYFLGVGVVRDMAGDDIYHSSRYGLAAAAHCAVGLFMDDAGRDTYEGKTAASMAGAWDIATCYFYDGAGDDTYRCDGLALGAASQNATGIFWDATGNDIYLGSAKTVGHAGGTEYAAGRLAKNFGMFIDSAGKDHYTREGRGNGASSVKAQHEMFVDE